MKKILVIDGQGGKLGAQLIRAILSEFPELSVTAVGTNSIATSTMLKAGAAQGATGENAAMVCAGNADIIVGPIGILIANSMLGEITPRMAQAIAQSAAKKILIPSNRCGSIVAGTSALTVSEMIEDAHKLLRKELE